MRVGWSITDVKKTGVCAITQNVETQTLAIYDSNIQYVIVVRYRLTPDDMWNQDQEVLTYNPISHLFITLCVNLNMLHINALVRLCDESFIFD